MRRAIGLLVAVLAMAPAATGQHAAADQLVREVIQAVNAAYARNDLDEYFSFYAADLTQWYPSGRVDLPTYRAQWTEYIAKGNRIEAADVSDLVVQLAASGDAAVASYRLGVTTRSATGEVTREEYQESDVLFKRNGAWQIVHLHYSPARARQ